MSGGGEDGAGWTFPYPRHLAYVVAVLFAIAGLGLLVGGLWYEDDACEGDTCWWGNMGFAAFFYAGIPAVLLAPLGAVWALADLLGLAHLPERLRLGFRPRIDALAVGVSGAVAGGYLLLVVIDDLNGL